MRVIGWSKRLGWLALLVGIASACSDEKKIDEQRIGVDGADAGGSGGQETADSGGVLPTADADAGATEGTGGAGGTGGTATGGASTGGTESSTGGTVAVDQYWCGHDAGARPDITVLAAGRYKSYELVGIADEQLHFTDGGVLKRVPVAGGAEETLGTIGFGNFVLSGENRLVGWRVTGEKGRGGLPITELLSAPRNDPTDVTSLVPKREGGDLFMTDDDNVYYSGENSGLYSVPLTGGTPRRIADYFYGNSGLVQDGHVYWMDIVDDTIKRVPVTGGTTELVSWSLRGDTNGLVSDGTSFYFTAPSRPGSTNVGWQVVKWTSNENLVELTPGSATHGLTLAGDTLFWSDGTSVTSVKTDGTERREYLCNIEYVNGFEVSRDYLIVAQDEWIFSIRR